MAFASAASSPGFTSRPVTPSATASGIPPARVATIARRHAIASSIAEPSPSVTELIANKSNDFISPSTSSRKPGRNT